MLTRKAQLLIRQEAVEGTFEAGIAAADGGILVYKPKFTPDAKIYERDPARATLSTLAPLVGGVKGTLTFQTELKGSGTAGTPPKWGIAMKAAGFAETVVALTSVAYAPASSGVNSCSLELIMDGVAHKMSGCRATVKLAAQFGQPAMLEYSFDGVYVGTVDLADVAGIVYDTTTPPIFMGANILTYDGINPVFTKLDMDMANKLALRENANSAGGYLSCLITSRKPTFSIDPEMVNVATYDYFSKMTSGAQVAIAASLGATAGNKVAIAVPKATATKIAPADRNGIYTIGLSGEMNMNTGDDELTITLT